MNQGHLYCHVTLWSTHFSLSPLRWSPWCSTRVVPTWPWVDPTSESTSASSGPRSSTLEVSLPHCFSSLLWNIRFSIYFKGCLCSIQCWAERLRMSFFLPQAIRFSSIWGIFLNFPLAIVYYYCIQENSHINFTANFTATRRDETN